MSLKILLAFALTEFLVDLTPGPAVLLVVSQGVKTGFRRSLGGVLGIETVNAFFFALSALGLGALLMASANLFQVIKWLGAGYLIFVGIKMLFFTEPAKEAEDLPVRSRRSLKLYSQGLITQLTNPKAILFFTALVPQFVSPTTHIFKQFVVLGIVSIAMEIPVLLAYAWLAERGGRLIPKAFSTLPERIAGVFLIGAGAGLASMRRP